MPRKTFLRYHTSNNEESHETDFYVGRSAELQRLQP